MRRRAISTDRTRPEERLPHRASREAREEAIRDCLAAQAQALPEVIRAFKREQALAWIREAQRPQFVRADGAWFGGVCE